MHSIKLIRSSWSSFAGTSVLPKVCDRLTHRFRDLPCCSQSVVSEVPVDVLEALVPVEDHVALAHAPDPLHAEVHHLLEVPRKQSNQILININQAVKSYSVN
jgi:hypothetical protein